MKRTLL
jgi:Type I site-specific restriction-modification system, R (restriction) subunit and related helicases